MPRIRKLFEIKEQKQEQIPEVIKEEEENKITTYLELTPGTAEWMRFWKQNPDKQMKMLEYIKGELP